MAAVSAAPRWFFGPASDLLLGCGLASAVVFGAHALLGAHFVVDAYIGRLRKDPNYEVVISVH